MTLKFAGQLDRSAVVHASGLVADLISDPAVAENWAEESSCAGMSVGGLTRHLAGQPFNIVGLLRAGPAAGAGSETIPVLEHYARAAWVREDHEGEVNRSIRETADQQAMEGVVAARAQVAEARAEIEAVLRDAPPTAYIPWQGWSLATDDFLVTRLMEMVVHADDLASSLALQPPDFGPTVLDPVLRLLTALAVHRHGQDAVVRALARPQRAPRIISAFDQPLP